MTLDDAQKQTVRQWIDDGMKVAEIQDKLVEAFDIKMTYMEVRFLVDDLGVIPKDPEPEQKPEDEPAAEETASSPSPQQDQQQDMGELMDEGAPAPGGKVSISSVMAVPKAAREEPEFKIPRLTDSEFEKIMKGYPMAIIRNGNETRYVPLTNGEWGMFLRE